MWLLAIILENIAVEPVFNNFQKTSERWWYPFQKRTVSVSKAEDLSEVLKPERGRARPPASKTTCCGHQRYTPASDPHPLSWLFISFQTGSESLSFFLHPYQRVSLSLPSLLMP